MAAHLYFNEKGNLELTNRIFEMIKGAKKYIKTGNFFFKDSKLKEALLDAMDRGVALFVISNLTGNENRGNAKVRVSDEVDPHIPHLHELHRSGAHVHITNDLHAKFLICDGKEGLLMSANYTKDSLYGNPENGVDITGNELKDLEFIFDKLYLKPDTLLSEDGKRYKYLKMKTPLPSHVFDQIGKNSRLLLTASSKERTNLCNCGYRSIYDKILELINNAQQTVIIVSWSYNQVEQLIELKEAIRKAISRGVIVCMYYGTKSSEDKRRLTVNQLAKLVGEENADRCCRPFKDNHAKCVLTDKGGMMFTANIDGKFGLLSGFELGCVLTEEQHIYCINRISQILYNGK